MFLPALLNLYGILNKYILKPTKWLKNEKRRNVQNKSFSFKAFLT